MDRINRKPQHAWLMALAGMSLLFVHEMPAAGEQTGRIAYLAVRASDGLIYADLEGTHSGKPACATNSYWIVKSEGSPAGRQQYVALLSAKLGGKSVRIFGGNSCTRWPDGEDIDGIFVLD